MMTSNQVKELIVLELGYEQDLTNINGLDLTRCLIMPIMQTYRLDNSEEVELWTVLRASSGGESYYIFYDEEEEMYGLGIKSIEGMHNIGYYGTFLQTINSM
jgi:hypothetical protein